MKSLVFASANPHKVLEIAGTLGASIQLRGLHEIGCTEEIPETSGTIEGNARQKAWYVFERYGVNCFADDTGLEVLALDNQPGVDSAFYAGPQKNPADNVSKLLSEMNEKLDRRARFRTVICLVADGKEFLFEGIAHGNIARERHGHAGFGYDPIFFPQGYSRTFAQMSTEEKNHISHRSKAIHLLKQFLVK